MPPYKVFALDHWIQQYAKSCKITLHDSMVYPLTLTDLQAFDPSTQIVSQNALLTYAAARGKPGLRKNIALLYPSADEPSNVTEEDILVTSGAISANQLVLETLLSAADDVVVQHPTYNQLIEIPRRIGANVHLWKQQRITPDATAQPTFGYNFEELRRLLSDVKPKLVVLNNPSNPTGALLNASELKTVLDLCQKAGAYVLCDEVFRFLHHDDTVPAPPSVLQFGVEKCIVTSSVSKAFALPGIRVGWIAVSSDLRETLLTQFGNSHDYTTIAVGCMDQDIAEFALRPDIKDKILTRSKEICSKNIDIIRVWSDANKGDIEFYPPRGAGTCVIKLKTTNGVVNDLDFVKRLVQTEKVFAPPAGACFGDLADGSGDTDLKGFLRIGVGIDSEKLKLGLEAISRTLTA